MSQRTRTAIMEAFTRQIEQKPLDRITVKDIVEDCDITRNTFYYHFGDIYGLAQEVLAERLRQISMEFAPNEDWEELLLLLARQMTQHTRSIRHLFRSTKSDEIRRFMAEIFSILLNHLFDHLAEGRRVSAEDRRLIIDFYRFAITGVAERWLKERDRQNPEELAHRLSLLLQSGMRQAIQDTCSPC